jgi:hypothetical protein
LRTAQVVRPGYSLDGKLIRPAWVAVEEAAGDSVAADVTDVVAVSRAAGPLSTRQSLDIAAANPTPSTPATPSPGPGPRPDKGTER